MTRRDLLFIPWGRWSRRTRRWIVLALGVALLVGGAGGMWWLVKERPAGDSEPRPIPHDLAPEAVVEPSFPSLTYGIQTFLWWNGTTRTWDLDMVRLMNFTHVKQIFAWADLEPFPGEWHWGNADGVVAEVAYRGLNLVARLDGPPEWAARVPLKRASDAPIDLDAWANYCGTVATRYQGQIAAYQVWNEPNLRVEWLDQTPNPKGYVRVLKACAEAIRQADPAAIIISAPLAPTGTWNQDAMPDDEYLWELYEADFAPYFDVLGLNAPGYAAPPDMAPEEAATQYGYRWMCFRHVEDMRAIMVAEGDAHKQVAVLEVGWTTDERPDSIYRWHAVTEEQQSDYLVGAYQYAAAHWRPWMGLMVTIYMSDYRWTPDDEEYWWAIDYPGFPPKDYRAAYIDLANMEKVMGDTIIPAREPGDPSATTVEPIGPREGEE